jgi:hypothetical protein
MELKTKSSRKYNCKRALCEDPVIIRDCCKPVQNTIVKYGIREEGELLLLLASAESRNCPKVKQPRYREWVSIIQGINSYG